MRTVIRTFLFALLVLGIDATLFAQRGAVAGAHFSAPPSHSVTASGGRPFPATRNYPAPLGLHSPAAGYTGIVPGALRSRSAFNRGFDYRRVPYTYFFAPYYYPFLDYGSSPYYDNGYDLPDPSGQAAMMAQNALGEQIQRLSAEVDELRSAQQPQMPAYAPSPGAAQESQQTQAPPVLLILRNGQRLQVQSYAVMDHTFWDFTKEPARKIPVSSIDIAASTRETEATGGAFPQMDSGQ